MGEVEFKSGDLGNDRGYRVVVVLDLDGATSKPAPFKSKRVRHPSAVLADYFWL